MQELPQYTKRQQGKISAVHEFPLKGFLKYPRCRGHISGIGSRGKKNVYYYYHCSKYGYRLSSRRVNPPFEDELIKYEYHEGINKLT